MISVHKNIPSMICGKRWQFASQEIKDFPILAVDNFNV